MASSQSRQCKAALGFAVASIVVSLLTANTAFASQGPGGGMGTAGHLTQLAMAILIYGTSAIVVGAGLIGAARGHYPRRQ